MRKKYSGMAMRMVKPHCYITKWAYEEGVFPTPQGKFIARIRKGNLVTTLAQYDTKEEAEKRYSEYKAANP